jgi:hypothetical protein
MGSTGRRGAIQQARTIGPPLSRLTLGEYKRALRDPAARRATSSGSSAFPTPLRIGASAVRRLHRDGVSASRAYLNQALTGSSYWGPSGRPHSQGWANAIRDCFETYIELAAGDHRPSLDSAVASDVVIGLHVVGVTVDVVLLDPVGYVARYVLWDVRVPTRDESEMLAAPIVAALGQELGADRIAAAEIWHLRTAAVRRIESAAALARLADTQRVVAAYLAD